MQKLGIYVDQELVELVSRHTLMVAPLLDDRIAQGTSDHAWARYAAIAPELFELTSAEDCAFEVLPYPWPDTTERDLTMKALRAHHRAGRAGRRIIVFSHMDDVVVPNLSDAYVFLTSMYRSTQRPQEFAQPALADDLLARYCAGQFVESPRGPRPVVGFCGYAPPFGLRPGRRWAKERVRAVADRLGVAHRAGLSTAMDLRARAIRTLESSPSVETNFVFRDDTHRDEHGDVGPWNRSDEYRRTFVDNIVASDYVLCTRGWGNFSFRLYETMALGRIPVFVDSDCVLPAEDFVDWQSLCVWVPEHDLADIGTRVREHYDRIGDELPVLQAECRRVWQQHLSADGFFTYLHGWLGSRA